MEIRTVHTGDQSLLRAIRDSLGGADEAVLAVAFASESGVHLIGRELERLRHRARLTVTTTFGTTTDAAIAAAHRYGTQIRVLNPPGSQTYHPKLYVARRDDGKAAAVIGSANLTGGLVNNVEIATVLKGSRDASPLDGAWRFATGLWARDEARDWAPSAIADRAGEGSSFDAQLLALIRAAVAENAAFSTLGAKPRPNRVVDVTPTDLYVETERSRDRGTGPQRIPAWMFELAWDRLRAHGALTNRFLLDERRVHRSSAVCAILARLPPVERVPGRAVQLRWRGG